MPPLPETPISDAAPRASIQDLPNEVLQSIFVLCPPYQFYRQLPTVCRLWRCLVSNRRPVGALALRILVDELETTVQSQQGQLIQVQRMHSGASHSPIVFTSILHEFMASPNIDLKGLVCSTPSLSSSDRFVALRCSITVPSSWIRKCGPDLLACLHEEITVKAQIPNLRLIPHTIYLPPVSPLSTCSYAPLLFEALPPATLFATFMPSDPLPSVQSLVLVTSGATFSTQLQQLSHIFPNMTMLSIETQHTSQTVLPAAELSHLGCSGLVALQIEERIEFSDLSVVLAHLKSHCSRLRLLKYPFPRLDGQPPRVQCEIAALISETALVSLSALSNPTAFFWTALASLDRPCLAMRNLTLSYTCPSVEDLRALVEYFVVCFPKLTHLKLIITNLLNKEHEIQTRKVLKGLRAFGAKRRSAAGLQNSPASLQGSLRVLDLRLDWRSLAMGEKLEWSREFLGSSMKVTVGMI
ncbi:uncharacterized protein BJ171DRAFT_599573 [Polychytrium aggregatum]|uniref:uncharacterized protein n=1 Tax=Polychytrium aggregatum TaxID=110093 RepID=UPI0022FE1D55|nr:uncharacterized protein BJ171DRAFT_599573 [Polychytrium aggregatum]KAI9204034.1 hypothetical protein BJ171DRAFT_599573 [Polychytrium aggregatum]